VGQQEDSAVLSTLMKFVGIMAVGAVFIYFLAGSMGGSDDATGGSDSMDKAVEERIAPVAKVQVAGDKPASAAPAKLSGKDVYTNACFACHGTGAAGAPKVGDKAAWTARIGQGDDKLYSNAINGFTGSTGVMPAKGGRADMSDDAIKAAVDYMVEQSK